MMKVICSRFSPSRWKIARHFFSRLFNVKARRASAKAISKHCSKPSNASRPREEIYEGSAHIRKLHRACDSRLAEGHPERAECSRSQIGARTSRSEDSK